MLLSIPNELLFNKRMTNKPKRFKTENDCMKVGVHECINKLIANKGVQKTRVVLNDKHKGIQKHFAKKIITVVNILQYSSHNQRLLNARWTPIIVPCCVIRMTQVVKVDLTVFGLHVEGCINCRNSMSV